MHVPPTQPLFHAGHGNCQWEPKKNLSVGSGGPEGHTSTSPPKKIVANVTRVTYVSWVQNDKMATKIFLRPGSASRTLLGKLTPVPILTTPRKSKHITSACVPLDKRFTLSLAVASQLKSLADWVALGWQNFTGRQHHTKFE